MQTVTSESQIRHVYRPALHYPGYFRFVLFAAVAYFVGFAIIGNMLSSHHDWLGAIIHGLVVTIIYSGGLVAFNVRSTRLVITPEAFEFSTWGQGYWAYWTDVERIGRQPFPQSLWMGSDGFYMPRIPSGQVSLRRFQQFRRFIPLTWFAPDWRHSPLGDDIRRYAPWLVEG